MSFVVIRHPEAGLGTVPASTLPEWEGRGWVAVSDERPEPTMFHLPDFAEPAAEPVQQPKRQAKPAKEDEEQ